MARTQPTELRARSPATWCGLPPAVINNEGFLNVAQRTFKASDELENLLLLIELGSIYLHTSTCTMLVWRCQPYYDVWTYMSNSWSCSALRQIYSYQRLKRQLLDLTAANCTDEPTETNSEEKSAFNLALSPESGVPNSHSFLLDPSFLNSFLPLEKKPFFFFPCAGLSVFVGLSTGRGAGREQHTSTAAGAIAGPRAGARSEVGLAEGAGLDGGSVCVVGWGRGGSVWVYEDSSAVEHPGCCGAVEDAPVPFRRKNKSFRRSMPNLLIQ